ncbi:MAG: endolytic transglycosylase MltG [Acidobacteria bacterium]|nr:endolytic transglycosylase MltG [Acidobacteriota bacterium]
MKRVQTRVLVTSLTTVLLGGLWLLADGTRPYLRHKSPVRLEIHRGESTWTITQQLQKVGAIRSRWTFLGLHFLRPDNTLKAGEYLFDRPHSAWEVLQKLVRGDIFYQVLTIPEGYNRFEIAELVAAQGFSTKEEFLKTTEDPSFIAELDPLAKNLEGYLFPDTYHLPPDAGPAAIVQALVSRFQQVYFSLKTGSGENNVREIVIMASLVEKETAVAGERPLVAAVFYNRLRRGMALQCDPTVIYAAILEGRYDGTIRQSLLNSPSPYNTYVHRGLPPGPIANPGKASLEAALRPASSDYLYFVADSSGGHSFSRTLVEHNRAVSLYQRGQPQ